MSVPFNVGENIDPLTRYGYWFTIIGAGLLFANFFRQILRRLPVTQSSIRQHIGLVGLMVVFFTPFLAELVRSMEPSVARSFETYSTFAKVVALVCTIISGVQWFHETKLLRHPRLLDRLPADKHGVILRVSARDHYVDVETSRGMETLLMRLSDALSELDGQEGLRIHRSHWVARRAIKGYCRDGARMILVLNNGDSLPVSRGQQDDVLAARIPELDGEAGRTDTVQSA